jgi:hypothetical protein
MGLGQGYRDLPTYMRAGAMALELPPGIRTSRRGAIRDPRLR